MQILYSERFADTYDYFRAIVARKEMSERALKLTEDALRLNAANYSVWHYRRDILKHLKCDLHNELIYIEQVIEDKPKNYQVWHHRRVIVEWLNDASQELNFTAKVLEHDAKNYHAWQHRQWVIKNFNLWEDELRYTDFLISEDIRNNSAWNQRYFVLQNNGGFNSSDMIDHEIHFVLNRIRLIKNNESSWNYLRGILQQNASNHGANLFPPDVINFAEELYAENNRTPYLLAFLFDAYKDKVAQGQVADEDERDECVRKAMEICNLLETKHDVIRSKYWKYMADSFWLIVDRVKGTEAIGKY